MQWRRYRTVRKKRRMPTVQPNRIVLVPGSGSAKRALRRSEQSMSTTGTVTGDVFRGCRYSSTNRMREGRARRCETRLVPVFGGCGVMNALGLAVPLIEYFAVLDAACVAGACVTTSRCCQSTRTISLYDRNID